MARYLRYLECLTELTSMSKPPRQPYKACLKSAFFVVGDATGKGKGNVVIEQYGADYESGAWNLEWREKSSNCRREAEYLTDRLERLVASDLLLDHKVFLITDNSSFEGAFPGGPNRRDDEWSGPLLLYSISPRSGRAVKRPGGHVGARLVALQERSQVWRLSTEHDHQG